MTGYETEAVDLRLAALQALTYLANSCKTWRSVTEYLGCDKAADLPFPPSDLKLDRSI